MTPPLARIKRAVRHGIDLCGGVDGAAATAERGRSVAGDWHNINHRAFPPMDCAFAIDEVAAAMGQRPAILAAYAAELGHVAIRLPESEGGGRMLAMTMIEASAEFGDVARTIAEGTRDGVLSRAERAAIAVQIDEAIGVLAQLRALAVEDC